MSDNATDVTSNTVSEPAKPAAPEMKSRDTSVIKPALEAAKAEKTQAETTPPAKPAKPEPQATSAGETEEGQDAGNGDDARSAGAPAEGKRKDRLPRWVQERIERTRETTRRETEDRIRAEYAQRAQAPEPPQARHNVQATNDRPPTLADFDFDMEAYTAHMIEREIGKRGEAARRDAAEAEHRASVERFKARVDDFETREGAGAWEDITTSELNTDPAFKAMTDLFMGSEHDLEIALHLARDITEARRINALPPLQRAAELARIAGLFTTGTTDAPPQAAPKPVPPKRVTSTPPPPSRPASAGKATIDANDPNISTADRIKLWKAQGLGR